MRTMRGGGCWLRQPQRRSQAGGVRVAARWSGRGGCRMWDRKKHADERGGTGKARVHG